MITKAEKCDGPQIQRLTESAGIFELDEVACVSELWDDYCRNGCTSGYSFVVFRDPAESVLGYACYGHHPLTEGTFDLYWLVVDPRARGHGIGRCLMEYVEEQVLAEGGKLLVVETSSTPDYMPAQRFYQTCGYGREAVVCDFYGPGDDLLLYTKQLGVEGLGAQHLEFGPRTACQTAEATREYVSGP